MCYYTQSFIVDTSGREHQNKAGEARMKIIFPRISINGIFFCEPTISTQVAGTPSLPIPYTMLHSVVSACPHLFG